MIFYDNSGKKHEIPIVNIPKSQIPTAVKSINQTLTAKATNQGPAVPSSKHLTIYDSLATKYPPANSAVVKKSFPLVATKIPSSTLSLTNKKLDAPKNILQPTIPKVVPHSSLSVDFGCKNNTEGKFFSNTHV
jgi:hypothetical protein